MLLDSFELQIKPQIYLMIENVQELEVKDIMLLIDWLEYYVGQLSVFEKGDRHCATEFLKIADDLIHEYLFRIKSQVMGWFDNIQKQKLEILKSSDGNLMTTMPEDMFNVIHMQVKNKFILSKSIDR